MDNTYLTYSALAEVSAMKYRMRELFSKLEVFFMNPKYRYALFFRQ